VRLAGLRFPHNARFVYVDDQFGDKDYWLALERVFREHGKSYWSAVSGLKARGGVYPRKFFAGVCGAADVRMRQLSLARILDRLKAIQLLEEFNEDVTGEPFVRFKPHTYQPAISRTLVPKAL
jgi:hypothetical protein